MDESTYFLPAVEIGNTGNPGNTGNDSNTGNTDSTGSTVDTGNTVDIGNSSYLPGFVMPAAVLLVALLSAAVVLYFTRVRGGSSDRDDA